MKKVYQKGKDDCYRAAIATYFNLDYESVPDFMPDEGMFERIEVFLNKLGFTKFFYPCSLETIPLIRQKEFYCVGVLKKPDREFSHAVILKVDNDFKGDECLVSVHHDPLVDSDYTIDDLWGFNFFIDLKKYKESEK